MDELIKQLSQRTGLPAAQAKQAAEFVVTFIKGKLPAPLASQVDAALEGGAGVDLGGLASKAGGLFSK